MLPDLVVEFLGNAAPLALLGGQRCSWPARSRPVHMSLRGADEFRNTCVAGHREALAGAMKVNRGDSASDALSSGARPT